MFSPALFIMISVFEFFLSFYWISLRLQHHLSTIRLLYIYKTQKEDGGEGDKINSSICINTTFFGQMPFVILSEAALTNIRKSYERHCQEIEGPVVKNEDGSRKPKAHENPTFYISPDRVSFPSFIFQYSAIHIELLRSKSRARTRSASATCGHKEAMETGTNILNSDDKLGK